MRPMIEPAAGRLFDTYYRHTSHSSLEQLQYLTEEAYKLHERLRKLSKKNQGLLGLDEFLLLKALRNYSVHQDDFVGEAFGIRPDFARRIGLELQKVCLIKKSIVSQAINYEPPLKHGEDEKIARIKTQLVDFGDFYNIEPVIFNFMVKVYEKLIALNLTIPGQGFADIDLSYKNEVYYNYSHYITLEPSNVNAEIISENLIPLDDLKLNENSGLDDQDTDIFKSFAELELDYSELQTIEYSGNDYEAIRNTVMDKLRCDSVLLTFAQTSPKHIGLAFVTLDKAEFESEFTCFNIGKQKAVFEKHKISLDDVYYETRLGELLVLYIFNGNIFPVIIYQSELEVEQKSVKAISNSVDNSDEKPKKSLQADKKKKAKRKQAAKARKKQRKR